MSVIIPGLAIDIGDSKIVLNAFKNNRFEKLLTLPNTIYWNNEISFSDDAITKSKQNAKYLITNLKCLSVHKYSDPFIQKMMVTSQFAIIEGENNSVLIEVCENNQIVYKTPIELLSKIITYAIQCAKDLLDNQDIQYLAVGFPPSFTELQKEIYMKVAMSTGIRHIELIPETTAVCLSYGFKDISMSSVLLIVDCGASSCNYSLVKCEDNTFQVIASDGVDIGGKNYTEVINAFVCQQAMNIAGETITLSRSKIHKLNQRIEDAKQELRDSKEAEIQVNESISVILSQARLGMLCKPLNNEICEKIRQFLEANQENQPSFLLFAGNGMMLRCLGMSISTTVGIEQQVMIIDEPVAAGLAMYLPCVINHHKADDSCNMLFTSTSTEEKFDEIYNASFPRPPRLPENGLEDSIPLQVLYNTLTLDNKLDIQEETEEQDDDDDDDDEDLPEEKDRFLIFNPPQYHPKNTDYSVVKVIEMPNENSNISKQEQQINNSKPEVLYKDIIKRNGLLMSCLLIPVIAVFLYIVLHFYLKTL